MGGIRGKGKGKGWEREIKIYLKLGLQKKESKRKKRKERRQIKECNGSCHLEGFTLMRKKRERKRREEINIFYIYFYLREATKKRRKKVNENQQLKSKFKNLCKGETPLANSRCLSVVRLHPPQKKKTGSYFKPWKWVHEKFFKVFGTIYSLTPALFRKSQVYSCTDVVHCKLYRDIRDDIIFYYCTGVRWSRGAPAAGNILGSC